MRIHTYVTFPWQEVVVVLLVVMLVCVVAGMALAQRRKVR